LRISVIVPVYNDRRVGRALDSILSQKTTAEMELIVVDGGSSDGTLDVLRAYARRITRLISEPDGGIYDAMNKGVAAATGDIVGILNADDHYADENVLSEVASAFSSSAVDACYGDLIYEDGRGVPVRRWRSGRFRRWKYYLGWMPPHPTFFARRSVYECFGGYDTSLRIAADYELMLKFIMKHRLRLAYVPRVMVRMSTGGSSNRSLRNIIRANVEVFHSWGKNGMRLGFFVPLLKPASKVLQFVWR
jgi:glycosyltransferase